MARAATRKKQNTDRAALDPAAILGLLAAAGMLLAAIFLGGRPAAFIDLPSVLIVIGGTLALTAASFPARDLSHAPSTIARALSPRGSGSPKRVALEGLAIAELARREDLRQVETRSGALAGRPILRRGIEMILDGTRIEQVHAALHREVAMCDERRQQAESVLRRAADVAPAMGLIGTLIGLVQMLGQLDDPTAIGPGMAVALLTTFYGAMLAHAVLTPLAERLSRIGDGERLQHEIQLLCVMSIAERENPRRLETILNGMLPPSEQLEEFA
ncbi:MAG: MotA/TolQ/ExbB proton channel family protein [Geminicoccaceae bacterium]|nr:MotA/TolQ/ExbB proton channel family protein [Geminicoccaceae bacterium]